MALDVLRVLVQSKQSKIPMTCTQMSHVMRKPVMPYANNKGTDHSARPRSLISTFVVCCLDSIISSFCIQNFKLLASFNGCAGWFESYLVENPEDSFSRYETQMIHPDFVCRPSVCNQVIDLLPGNLKSDVYNECKIFVFKFHVL